MKLPVCMFISFGVQDVHHGQYWMMYNKEAEMHGYVYFVLYLSAVKFSILIGQEALTNFSNSSAGCSTSAIIISLITGPRSRAHPGIRFHILE